IVRREQKRFVKDVDALLRFELKKNTEYVDIIPAIKTRQAIRMIANDLLKELDRLKEDGQLNEYSVWRHLLQKLRAHAERVIRVPPLTVSDWLHTVPWIKQICNEVNRNKLVDELVKSMHKEDGTLNLTTFKPHAHILTNGHGLFFVQDGVCKVREWIVGRRINDPNCKPWDHQSYIQQGQIIGERNLLLIGRNFSEKFHVKWPKIRYDSVTPLRGVWIPEERIRDILYKKEYLSIRPFLAERLQLLWMLTEIKHLERQFDVM
ncbi:hypothetical protein PMAYCL1PPCAC_02950, partial [Pristionchus mayeri]